MVPRYDFLSGFLRYFANRQHHQNSSVKRAECPFKVIFTALFPLAALTLQFSFDVRPEVRLRSSRVKIRLIGEEEEEEGEEGGGTPQSAADQSAHTGTPVLVLVLCSSISLQDGMDPEFWTWNRAGGTEGGSGGGGEPSRGWEVRIHRIQLVLPAVRHDVITVHLWTCWWRTDRCDGSVWTQLASAGPVPLVSASVINFRCLYKPLAFYFNL